MIGFGVVMALVTSAEARIPRSVTHTGIDAQCLTWQDRVDRLVADHPHASAERRAEILNEGKQIVVGWDTYCEDRWGSIFNIGATCAEALFGLPCAVDGSSGDDDTHGDDVLDFDEVVYGLDPLCMTGCQTGPNRTGSPTSSPRCPTTS